MVRFPLVPALTACMFPALLAGAAPTAAQDLRKSAETLARNPDELAARLPEIRESVPLHELGPFFDGLLPRGWNGAEFEKRLDLLDPLMNAGWLDAATGCGAFDFTHQLLVHRGQLQQLLESYQDAGDEIAIIRLGEALADHAGPVSGIAPGSLSTRTLALFLSGAFGASSSEPQEPFTLVKTATRWIALRPDLLPMFKTFQGDRPSLQLLESTVLWQQKQRREALAAFTTTSRLREWTVASSVNSLLLESNLPAAEIRSLAQLLPTGVLVSAARQLLDDDVPGDAQARIAEQMIPEFHSRNDRQKDHWIPFSLRKARKTALVRWIDGRDEDAFNLLQEAFFNLKPTEQSDNLLRFAVIARSFGKEAAVMKELEKRAAGIGYGDLGLHKAALLTVEGKPREALALARAHPEERLFHRLLIECEQWDELRDIAFGPSAPYKEVHQRICNAVFLNRDAASARTYFLGLPPTARDRNAMFLLLSGNDELCREITQAQVATALSYRSLPFPISLKPFETWEAAILKDLDAARPPLADTLRRYTTHIGMARDRARSIAILDRVTKIENVTRQGGSSNETVNKRNAWESRVNAAHALIELGAVEQGQRTLEQMAKTVSDERESKLLNRQTGPAPKFDEFKCLTDIEPKPGDFHDPKSAGFKPLDGMNEIRRLLSKAESDRAAVLFHDVTIRILLDDFPKEKVTVRRRTNRENHSARTPESADAIPVIAAQYWNLDAPFLRDYAITAWRCGWDSDDNHLAPLLARYGYLHEAQIAALELQRDGETDDLESIHMLAAIDGLADATAGRVDAALDRLEVCMNLAPFDPRAGTAILHAFQKRGDKRALDQATARIRDYWKQRLAEYPDSPHIREASHYWLSELAHFH